MMLDGLKVKNNTAQSGSGLFGRFLGCRGTMCSGCGMCCEVCASCCGGRRNVCVCSDDQTRQKVGWEWENACCRGVDFYGVARIR